MKRADVERFKLSNSLTATVLYCLLGTIYLIMGFEINETIKSNSYLWVLTKTLKIWSF